MKKLISVIMTMIMVMSMGTIGFAEGEVKKIESKNNLDYREELAISESDINKKEIGESKFINDFRNRKVKVKYSNEWSTEKRISDDLTTLEKGGVITSTKSATFSGSFSGDIKGINVNLGGSKTSSIGYTLNVGAYQTKYMVYKVLYEVEKGENEMYDLTSGKVISSKPYTAKRIIKGEYSLR